MIIVCPGKNLSYRKIGQFTLVPFTSMLCQQPRQRCLSAGEPAHAGAYSLIDVQPGLIERLVHQAAVRGWPFARAGVMVVCPSQV